ncbi:hypothetical protein C2845_PM15G17350 [Panicum miliaceum]|uniref:NAC domain-containing protein n=1 Tax=Panicum miliaceum TaxID=4540 RepID=A0A3L6Q9A2_PANMI|nr:hypothetical protein C2845_PM15G17350 [Panicum miliaceum]
MAGVEERPSGGGDDEEGNYPVGFRFKPTLRELVEFYLLPKLLDKPTVPNDAIIEADAYECDPEILTKRYEERGADDNWYFLSPRSRRYPGGDRPTRRTADNRGRWKPSTGQSNPGKKGAAGHSKAKGPRKNLSVGAVEFTENALAYYAGEPKNETKTKWLMHELTVPEPGKERGPESATGEKPRDHMLLNKYVMCRIYKSPLKKWREVEDEEGSTSSVPACDEPAPSSSQSGPVPESVAETSSARATSSKSAGKRPAVGQPSGHAASAPNKRASSRQTMPPGQPGPTTHANGRGGMRAPPSGVGAAGYYHGVPGLPPLMQWPPPPMYNSMQGPVQLLRPPMTYEPNRQGRPPVLRLCPPHRPAAATAPNSLGRTVMTRPPNLAASQLVRPPPPFPRPPPGPQLLPQQQMEAMKARVLQELLAELKSRQGSASFAGQQHVRPTASTQPAWGADLDHPAGAQAMVPRTQFPAPHNLYPCSGGVQQQQQQSDPAVPAARVPPSAAGPVEATPAADDAPGKLSVSGDPNEGSAKGDCYGYSNQLFEDFLADLGPVKN